MTKLHLEAGSIDALARFVATQLHHIVPGEGRAVDERLVRELLPTSLARMAPILAAVRSFTPGSFNHLNSLQHATLLYLLGNEQWRRHGPGMAADRLFCLNRALNSIDLFYAVDLPTVFFISHGLGSVLGNAVYGDRLVVFQNVTVGRVGNDRPTLGADVVLYPGAVVTGRSVVGDRSVVSAGTVVHGVEVPPDSVVTAEVGSLVVRPRQRQFADLYFRALGSLS
jgi:serine O-acetyltransferase